jgi:hypothetical protein
MTLRTWTIEIRADFDTKDKEILLLNDIKQHVKEINGTALLLADKRQPQVSFSTSDMFAGSEQIALFVEGEYDEDILT